MARVPKLMHKLFLTSAFVTRLDWGAGHGGHGDVDGDGHCFGHGDWA